MHPLIILKNLEMIIIQRCQNLVQKYILIKRSTCPCDLVHSNVWYALVTSIFGHRYFYRFIDDATRVTWEYHMKTKDEVVHMFKTYYKMTKSLITNHKFLRQMKQQRCCMNYCKSTLGGGKKPDHCSHLCHHHLKLRIQILNPTQYLNLNQNSSHNQVPLLIQTFQLLSKKENGLVSLFTPSRLHFLSPLIICLSCLCL